MIGILGGTGLYAWEGLNAVDPVSVDTPFGKPSDRITLGEVNGKPFAFLPRHGARHQHLPGEINFRANLWALKAVGVRRVISVSAVGSLRENIRPGDLALPDQYIDFTRGKRAGSYFGDGLTAHVSTAEPTCPEMRTLLATSARALEARVHEGGTYVCVEGPRLGTRAESRLFRQWGVDLVGMTNVPEAFLAREAQLCYASLTIATDYDCWLEDPSQHASVEQVMTLYRRNLEKVRKILLQTLESPGAEMPAGCGCRESLRHAVMSDGSGLSSEKAEILAFLRL